MNHLKLSGMTDEVAKLNIPCIKVTDEKNETTNISVYLKYYKVHEKKVDKVRKIIEKLDKTLIRKDWIPVVYTNLVS